MTVSTLRESEKPGCDDKIEGRVATLGWEGIRSNLDSHGSATTGVFLTKSECEELTALYECAELFRRRIVMASHGFGKGEYRYFDYPLPLAVEALRLAFYERLAPIANAWNAELRLESRFPQTHAEYIGRCQEAGQCKPTPLLLKYREGDYNCLHQDLYGELVFPFQVAFLLSEPGKDFTGGEFVLTEQRPRMQSRVEAVPLRQGEGVIFPVNHRPGKGSRGVYRTAMRHGVSRIRSGQRFTMGLIFHDAA